MLVLTIFGAPLAFAALSVYLLVKIQPVPITLIPQTADNRSKTRERVTA